MNREPERKAGMDDSRDSQLKDEACPGAQVVTGMPQAKTARKLRHGHQEAASSTTPVNTELGGEVAAEQEEGFFKTSRETLETKQPSSPTKRGLGVNRTKHKSQEARDTTTTKVKGTASLPGASAGTHRGLANTRRKLEASDTASVPTAAFSSASSVPTKAGLRRPPTGEYLVSDRENLLSDSHSGAGLHQTEQTIEKKRRVFGVRENDANTNDALLEVPHPPLTSVDVETQDEDVVLEETNKGGLVEAVPVSEWDDPLQLTEAQAVDPSEVEKREQRRKERNYRHIGIGLFVLSFVVIMVVVLVLLLRPKSTQGFVAQMTTSPTVSTMPSSMPSSMPSKALYDIEGLPESTKKAIGTGGSPQEKAYNWVYYHPDFSTMENWRKVQLLALATFYYSFEENWPKSLKWMDYSLKECSWTTSLDLAVSTPDPWDFPSGYKNVRACMTSSMVSMHEPDPNASNCDRTTEEFRFFQLRVYFQGTLPVELFLLSSITTFDLTLDYGRNGFNGTIPTELGLLTALTDLNLGSNSMIGPIPSEIGLLASLKKLDLSFNKDYLSGTIPTTIGWTNLDELYLQDNSFTGPIPSEIGLLSSSLSRMELRNNSLEGMIPTEIGYLSALQRLDATGNLLTGLPTELGLLQSIEYWSMADNALAGSIPSEIGSLSGLLFLDLGKNLLTGPFPSTFDDSNMTQIVLQGNQLSLIPTEIGILGNRIERLDISDNKISILPSELFLLTGLNALNIDGNLISSIPSEILQMTNLEPCWDNVAVFSLNRNKIEAIPTVFGVLPLIHWALDDNNISALPEVDWGPIPRLSFIHLARNNLSGTIPIDLGLQKTLTFLDFSSNLLTGPIPSEVVAIDPCTTDSCYIGMFALQLSNNYLTGSIPTELELHRNLRILDLSHNNLTSFIPAGLSLVMETLNLNNNAFTGSLPTEFGNISCITIFDVSGNSLSGEIPSEFGMIGKSLRQDHNDSAVLAMEWEYEWYDVEYYCIKELALNNNALQGTLPSELGLLTSLELLALSSNNLTGTIPSELGNLNSTICDIFLFGNKFNGSLPVELCPWHCETRGCFAGDTPAQDTNATSACGGGVLLVDCSEDSLLDCSTCSCGEGA